MASPLLSPAGDSTLSGSLCVCHLCPWVLHTQGKGPQPLACPGSAHQVLSGLDTLLLLWVLPESSFQKELLPGQVMSSLSLGVSPHLLVMVLRDTCLSRKLGW